MDPLFERLVFDISLCAIVRQLAKAFLAFRLFELLQENREIKYRVIYAFPDVPTALIALLFGVLALVGFLTVSQRRSSVVSIAFLRPAMYADDDDPHTDKNSRLPSLHYVVLRLRAQRGRSKIFFFRAVSRC